MLVLGVLGDRICRPDDVAATAKHHAVSAMLLPGMAHMMMLEPGWETIADAVIDWIATQ